MATGVVVTTPRIEVDLRVKFADFNSVEHFVLLAMDGRYDLILGMPWLMKHEPWIDWKTKSIGSTSRVKREALEVSDPSFVFNHTSEACSLDEGNLEVGVCADVEWSPSSGQELTPAGGNQLSTPEMSGGEGCRTGTEKTEVSHDFVLSRGTAPALGTNAVTEGESHESVLSGDPTSTAVPDVVSMLTSHPRVLSVEVAPAPGPGAVTGNTSHREVLSGVTTPASDAAVTEVAGYRVQRELREEGIGPIPATTRVVDALTGQELNLSDLEVDPVPFDGNLGEMEELSLPEFEWELKAGAYSELVILTPPKREMELNSSSVVDETVADDFRQRFESRRGAQIMKNPEDKYYPLLKRFSTRCLNPKPPDGLPPDRGVRHEIDLKPGSGYCVLRQWPLSKEQSDIIDAFFDKKQRAGLLRFRLKRQYRGRM
ncbi:hypothetical protein P43SY_011814 [Pythium insidiosum]|uniref:Pol protein n=1 Tax=Pythium insidiosum TaxID=114742 RepID=A0AAD5Q0S0_PYTIN|nr:hypothetical protein P43SY_011814 [Pythium insidiosum]